MEKIGLNQLREMFLSFYESKDHYRRQSFSLIPEKDKSLLIVNSGMAPLKPYFAGLETPPSKRMTTCQKCIRTGDIDKVGYTARHGTFFEMLGSFSFGDYFKLDSIKWGWEFITEKLNMPKERLWATVYEDDDEAFDIWKDVIGLPPERIVRLGKDDNFWEIGTGPCGPCSEIYYDRGPEYGCGKENCKPGCECDRYLEFWNHVFTQFNRDDLGNYTELAHKNIDTGMGLERIACIMQGVDSIFDVDTIKYILDAVISKSGVKYEEGKAKTDVSLRIITDHLRSVSFMIADGIIPSNEGRGYVLRRLLRRAARHGRLLGIQGQFLADLAAKVVEISGGAYPELEEKKAYLRKVVRIEEEKFDDTIDQGEEIISHYIDELKSKGETVLHGDEVFKLYDTYGFPLELTQEILEESGYTADVDGFNENMKRQKEQARAARKNEEDEGWKEASVEISIDVETQFTGYDKAADTATVIALIKDKSSIYELAEGETAALVLDKTPFYAESGGQSYDTGIIYNDACTLEVLEVSKIQNVFVHKVVCVKGALSVGDEVNCHISEQRRNSTARNHTATHLLHKALRIVLGEHVHQAGSSVTPDTLRFDFNHFEAMTKEQIEEVEEIVNSKIGLFLPVHTEELTMDEAVQKGITALFGEKYGNIVRAVSVGGFSSELCGGTHVFNSGQIGSFKIVSESGVASGVRRIEAVTGAGVLNRAVEAERIIAEVSEILKTNHSGLIKKAANVSDENRMLKREVESLKKSTLNDAVGDMIAEAKDFNGVKLVAKSFTGLEIDDLRSLSDEIKANYDAVVIVLAAVNEGKVTFIVSVTDDLLDKGYHAGNMVKQIAAAAGGGGGGKADMAQAGAKDPALLEAAFKVAESLMNK